MNEPSLRKFGPTVAEGGLVLYNRDRLPGDYDEAGTRHVCVPASEMADAIGSAKVANVVMLGALLEATGALSPATAMEVLEEKITRPELLELDRRALEAGAAFVREHAGALTG